MYISFYEIGNSIQNHRGIREHIKKKKTNEKTEVKLSTKYNIRQRGEWKSKR